MAGNELALQIVLNAQDRTKAAFNAVVGALGGALVGALSDAARAAADEDAGIAQLVQSLDNAGLSYKDLGQSIEAKIAAQQRSLAFGDGPQRDSLQRLVTITKDVDKAFKLQGLAMDLARAKNLDLITATEIVGKVASGNMGILSRYGITLDKGATSTEALAEMQRRFGGQAETYGRSQKGALEAVKLAFDDAQESIGGMLGPLQGMFALLPGLSAGMTMFGGTIGMVGGHAKQLLSLLNPITLAKKAWAIAQGALNLVMSANPIAIVVLALAGLAIGLKFAYDNSAQFRAVVQIVWEWLGQLLAPLKFVADALGALGRAVGLVPPKTENMKTEVTRDFSDMKVGSTNAMQEMETGVRAEVQKIEEYVPAALKRMKQAGVEDARAMETDTVLAAMGMSTSVREKIAEMVAGVTGKTAEERDQIIWDMQTARLQAALRAAGMSEDVVAAIDGMVFSSKTKLEEMRVAHGEKFRAMKERQVELRDSSLEAARGTDALRVSIESLRDKTVTVTVNRVSMGGGGGDFIAAAKGFDGPVTRPTLFLAGEAGAEHVRITPGFGGGRGGPSGRTVIENRIYLDGRVIAEVVGEHQVRRVDALGGRFQ